MRIHLLAWLTFTAALAAACGGPAVPSTSTPPPTASPATAATVGPLPQVLSRQFQAVEGGSEFATGVGDLVTVAPRDAIPAILEPAFVSREEAEAWMDSDEMVLGLAINGDVRAYPIRMLSWHEVVNDTVGGRPVVVTW